MRKSIICPTAGVAFERRYNPEVTLGDVLITICRLAKRVDDAASAAKPIKLAVQVQCSMGVSLWSMSRQAAFRGGMGGRCCSMTQYDASRQYDAGKTAGSTPESLMDWISDKSRSTPPPWPAGPVWSTIAWTNTADEIPGRSNPLFRSFKVSTTAIMRC